MSNAHDILKGHDDFMRNMHKDREFKGTPGPWWVESFYYTLDIKENARVVIHAQTKSEKYSAMKIAEAAFNYEPSEYFVDSKIIAEANANLIAAAPDLLEALVMAVEEYKKLPHSLGYDFTHLPKMEAAIAKALGENNV